MSYTPGQRNHLTTGNAVLKLPQCFGIVFATAQDLWRLSRTGQLLRQPNIFHLTDLSPNGVYSEISPIDFHGTYCPSLIEMKFHKQNGDLGLLLCFSSWTCVTSLSQVLLLGLQVVSFCHCCPPPSLTDPSLY